MISTPSPTTDRAPAPTPPGAGVIAIAVLMALWCIGFAVVNIVFEVTDHFAGGPYADYTSAFTVVNWLVVALKGLGAVTALLSVADRRSVVPAAVVNVLVWAAAATLGAYALGSVAEVVGMVSGLTGSIDQITVAGVGYLLFVLLAAAGYGVLAVAHSRRHRLGKRFAVLGALGAPVVLGGLLLAVPALLTALGVMPTT